jgi:hypothetical protein
LSDDAESDKCRQPKVVEDADCSTADADSHEKKRLASLMNRSRATMKSGPYFTTRTGQGARWTIRSARLPIMRSYRAE